MKNMKFLINYKHELQSYVQVLEFKWGRLVCIIDDKRYLVRTVEVNENEVRMQLLNHETITLKDCCRTQLRKVLIASYAASTCENVAEKEDEQPVMIFLLQQLLMSQKR